MNTHFEDRLLESLQHVVTDERRRSLTGGPAMTHARPRRVITIAATSLAGVAATATAVAVGAAFVPGNADQTATAASDPAGAVTDDRPVIEDGMILMAQTAGEKGPIQVIGPDGSPREDLVAVLREAGLEVEVNEFPGSPSIVGTCDGISIEDAPGATISADDLTWTVDPEVFEGYIGLTCFRTPNPGEEIEAYGSAFGSGEPLAGVQCRLSPPFTAQELEDASQGTGVTLRWTESELDGPGGTAGPAPSGYVVTSASAIGDGVIDVRLTPEEGFRADEWFVGSPETAKLPFHMDDC